MRIVEELVEIWPNEVCDIWCIRVDILERLCDDDLERSYNSFTTTNIYFTGAAYNSYFSNYL